eukprot:1316197-Prymnesium_polylepis.1
MASKDDDDDSADSEDLWHDALERERLEQMTLERRQLQEKTYLEQREALEKARDAATATGDAVGLAAEVSSLNERLARYVEFVRSLEQQSQVWHVTLRRATRRSTWRQNSRPSARAAPHTAHAASPPALAPPAGDGGGERRAARAAGAVGGTHGRRAGALSPHAASIQRPQQPPPRRLSSPVGAERTRGCLALRRAQTKLSEADSTRARLVDEKMELEDQIAHSTYEAADMGAHRAHAHRAHARGACAARDAAA